MQDYDEADPKCLDAIYAAKRAIDTTPMEELVTAFNLCDLDGSALGPHKTDLFLYGLEGLCQQNYPYQIDEMPAWPVNAVCNVLVGAYNDGDSSREAMLAASVSVTYTALGLQREQVPSCCSMCVYVVIAFFTFDRDVFRIWEGEALGTFPEMDQGMTLGGTRY